MAETILVMDPGRPQGSLSGWQVEEPTWMAFRDAFRELVRSHVAEKLRQNHMGKKSFRALKRLNKALEAGNVAGAICEAVGLGMKSADIVAVALLLDFPVTIVNVVKDQ